MAMPKMPPATPFAWAWNLTVIFFFLPLDTGVA